MRYLIIANGNFLPIEILQQLASGAIVLALDGAAARISELGLSPDIIFGDFDSLRSESKWCDYYGVKATHSAHLLFDSYQGKHDTQIIAALDQSKTDLEKALLYAQAQGASQVDIVCAFSETRLDHMLYNIRLLKSLYQATCRLFLHSASQTIQYVCNQTITIHGQVGDSCAVFAFPQGEFSATGLAWQPLAGQAMPLDFAHAESVANKLMAKTATITVHGSAIVISPFSPSCG